MSRVCGICARCKVEHDEPQLLLADLHSEFDGLQVAHNSSPRSMSYASRSARIGLARATRNAGSRAASGRRSVHDFQRYLLDEFVEIAAAQAMPPVAQAGSNPVAVSPGDWRSLGFGLLRIVFGLIWAVDAYFKWLPDFHNNFDDYLNKAAQGRPDAVSAWINFWVQTVGVNPHLFGYFVAVAETAVAIGLIFGVLSNAGNAGLGGDDG